MEEEEQRDKIAKALARAFWRGRLESLRTNGFEDGVLERMIQVAGEADFERWRQDATPAADLHQGLFDANIGINHDI
jgi:hypothetical protein